MMRAPARRVAVISAPDSVVGAQGDAEQQVARLVGDGQLQAADERHGVGVDVARNAHCRWPPRHVR